MNTEEELLYLFLKTILLFGFSLFSPDYVLYSRKNGKVDGLCGEGLI
ncbi:MAG TPA: hypothetical protein PLB53_05320 [Candidatus Atribacteria bacterium]|nr:hypothetical protein [Candidatus Atribacteria bacterium]